MGIADSHRTHYSILEASCWVAEKTGGFPSDAEIYYLCLAGKLRLCWEPSNYYAVEVRPVTHLKNYFGGGENDPSRAISFDLDKLKAVLGGDARVEEGLEILSDRVRLLDGIYEICWQESVLERWIISLAKKIKEYDQYVGRLLLKSIDAEGRWYEVREEYPENDKYLSLEGWHPSNIRPDERELVILRSDLEALLISEAQPADGSKAESQAQLEAGVFVLPANPDDLARAICFYGNTHYRQFGSVPEPMALFATLLEDPEQFGVQSTPDGTSLGYINASSELKSVDKRAYLARYKRYIHNARK